MDASDPFHLQRFVDAQDGSYQRALAEVRRARKTGHWMWFVFPQLVGLGSSPMAQRYAIGSLDEARAYLAHPLLGARLREIVGAVLAMDAGVTADGVFGSIDAVKLRSSMTLFARAEPAEPLFRAVLDRYYSGTFDPATDRLLDR